MKNEHICFYRSGFRTEERSAENRKARCRKVNYSTKKIQIICNMLLNIATSVSNLIRQLISNINIASVTELIFY